MSGKSIKWDAHTDAKFFALVIQTFNIKLGGENLKRLNIAMGLAPNSQSLTHRLGFLKKQANSPNAGAAGDDVKSVTPRPRARKTKTPKKSRKDSVVEVEEDEEFRDVVLKSEPATDPEHTPFYNGGTKSLKRKGNDSDDDDYEPNGFTRSLMGGKGPAGSSKKTKANPVEENEEEDDDFMIDMSNETLWNDQELAI